MLGFENSFCLCRTSSINPRQPGVTNADTRSDAASVDDAAPINNFDAVPVDDAALVDNVDAVPVDDAAPVDNVDAVPVNDAAPVDNGDADAAPVSHVDAAPDKYQLISKPSTTRIGKRRILCKKRQGYTTYSSSGSVRVNSKTLKETMSIRATCGIYIHPTKDG